MGSTSVQIEGVDQLLAKLGEIEAKGVRKVMLKSLVEGAKELRTAIREEAPTAAKDTTGKYAHARGALKAGVRFKASRKRTGQLAYMIGPFGKGTAQRHLVVGGHEIVGHKPKGLVAHALAKAGHELAGKRTGKRTTPNPFVERGQAKAESRAFDAVAAKARSSFDEITRG